MVEGLVGSLGVVVLVELLDELNQPGLGPDRPVRVEELLNRLVQPFVLARVVGLLGRPVIGVTPWRRR